jgi:hypothetical protein
MLSIELVATEARGVNVRAMYGETNVTRFEIETVTR